MPGGSARHCGSLFVFAFALIVRVVYLQFVPPPSLKWLPYQFDLRASQLLAGETVFFPDAWASFHVVLAGFYAVFERFGTLDQRVLIWAYVQCVMAAISSLYPPRLDRFTRFPRPRNPSLPPPFPNLKPPGPAGPLRFAVKTALPLPPTSKPSVKTAIAAGVLLGIALICRPILTPFFPLLGVWMVATLEKGKRVKHLAALALAVASIATLAASVNAATGKYHRLSYSGNMGANVALAQCRLKTLRYQLPSGERFWFSPPSSWKQSLPTVKTDVPFYDNGYYLRMGLNCLIENPSRLVGNLGHLARLYHSVFYPTFVDSRHHGTLIDAWKFPAVILTLAFMAAPLVNREWAASKGYWLFASLLISLFIATYVANPGEERHLVPYFWVLIPYGLPALLHILREHPRDGTDRHALEKSAGRSTASSRRRSAPAPPA